jgi:hypothetical protein
MYIRDTYTKARFFFCKITYALVFLHEKQHVILLTWGINNLRDAAKGIEANDEDIPTLPNAPAETMSPTLQNNDV